MPTGDGALCHAQGRGGPVTASHRPADAAPVQFLTAVPRAARRAQKRLLADRRKLGSWAAVARATGLDKGLLRRVALGQQRAPAAVIRALSKEQPRVRYRPTLADARLWAWALLCLLRGAR